MNSYERRKNYSIKNCFCTDVKTITIYHIIVIIIFGYMCQIHLVIVFLIISDNHIIGLKINDNINLSSMALVIDRLW